MWTFADIKHIMSTKINIKKEMFFFHDENDSLFHDGLNVIQACFPFSKVSVGEFLPSIEIKELK